ncbi:MAG: hypothetical protein KatS3mg110_2616 [Pirellulaceae bacterium]|nr:MAG: hypothetical protein KatS3mg110_2616 [Pirellulaceae bacterium]
MSLSQSDVQQILNDNSKYIQGDVTWRPDRQHAQWLVFRVPVHSQFCGELYVKGSYNPSIPALSYALILDSKCRIYALDLGKRHHNPDCTHVGPKHKHVWTDAHGDKWAYEPSDITADATKPADAWTQFCREAKIHHRGRFILRNPF